MKPREEKKEIGNSWLPGFQIRPVRSFRAKRVSVPWGGSGPWIPQFRLPARLQAILARMQAAFRADAAALPGPLFVLANDENDSIDRVEGVSNDFQPLQGDWVQLSPYGQFPHPRGLQYFAKSDAEKIVANFNSLKSKLLRRFGGLPWYEGHPDTSPKDYPNKKSFGWIDGVEARDDGLYGHVKWTKAGAELVAEGHYKYFSPVWHATPAKVDGKSVLRPDELISVGFTNTPNMPVLPLSNDSTKCPACGKEFDQADVPETSAGAVACPNCGAHLDQEGNQLSNENDTMKLPNSILKTLGFADDAKPTEAEIVAAWDKFTAETLEPGQTAVANVGALANEKETLGTELENAKKSITNLGEQLDTTSKAFDAERIERIELLVATNIANGKITKADAEKWKAELKEDFAGKSVELANVKPALANTAPLTKDLGKNQAALETGATPRETARALANEKVAAGKRFEVAWQEVKKERPDLFQGMKQPQGKAA